jgi:hypothetical protein
MILVSAPALPSRVTPDRSIFRAEVAKPGSRICVDGHDPMRCLVRCGRQEASGCCRSLLRSPPMQALRFWLSGAAARARRRSQASPSCRARVSPTFCALDQSPGFVQGGGSPSVVGPLDSPYGAIGGEAELRHTGLDPPATDAARAGGAGRSGEVDPELATAGAAF